MGTVGIDRDRMGREFEAAIDELEQTLRACPDDLWEAPVWPVQRTDPWIWPAGREPVPERTEESIQRFSAFWCVAYHCLWFLDYYTHGPSDAADFESPDMARGGPEELGFAADGAVAVPDRTFSREAMVAYAAFGRVHVPERIASATEERLATRFTGHHPRAGETYAEVLRVNLDHVREHGGQLRRFLAERAG